MVATLFILVTLLADLAVAGWTPGCLDSER